jgi:hypothetical protein
LRAGVRRHSVARTLPCCARSFLRCARSFLRCARSFLRCARSYLGCARSSSPAHQGSQLRTKLPWLCTKLEPRRTTLRPLCTTFPVTNTAPRCVETRTERVSPQRQLTFAVFGALKTLCVARHKRAERCCTNELWGSRGVTSASCAISARLAAAPRVDSRLTVNLKHRTL